MFEAYAVGVTLRLNNLITPQLLILAGEFDKLHLGVTALNGALTKLGKEAASIRALSPAINSSTAAFDRASRSASSYQSRLAAIHRQSAIPVPGLTSLPLPPMLRPSPIPLPLGAGGGTGGGGKASAGGKGLLHGGNIHLGPNGIGMGSIGIGAGNAIVPLAIGAALLYGGHALYESAKEMDKERARFEALGLGAGVTKQAVDFADGMHIMGQSRLDGLKLLRESTTIMGSFEHAKEIAPFLARMKFGLESVMGEGSGDKFEGMFQAVMKTAELRGALINRSTGLIDVEKFKSAANHMNQAYVASGGLTKPQDYLAMMKTGGVSTKLMGDEMFYGVMGHFMQESGGSRVGTASMTMFQQMAMGTMSQAVSERLDKLGLLVHKAVHYGKNGHISRVDPMGVVNVKGFVDNPFQWTIDTVVAAVKKANPKADQLTLDLMLSSLYGVRTAKNLASTFAMEAPLVGKFVANYKTAANAEKLAQLGEKTLSGQEMIFNAAWKDFKNTFSSQALPAFTNILTGGTGLIHAIEQSLIVLSKIPGLVLPDSKDDGALHPGRHWVPGAGRGGTGGAWELDGRVPLPIAVGTAPRNSQMQSDSYAKNFRTARSTVVNVHVANKVDARGLATMVTQQQNKELRRPTSNARDFDGNMNLQGNH